MQNSASCIRARSVRKVDQEPGLGTGACGILAILEIGTIDAATNKERLQWEQRPNKGGIVDRVQRRHIRRVKCVHV